MGGAQRFLYELITNLNKDRYEISVAAGGSGELFEKLRRFKGVEVVHIKNFLNTFSYKNPVAFFEIFRLIKKIKPDILYLLSSEAGFLGSIAGNLYRFLIAKTKPKIIYRIGGWAFKEPRNILIKKLYLWAEKLSAPFKDIIITNSEFDRQLAIKNKITKPSKIITIHNGVNIHELKFLPKEEARKFLNSKIPNSIIIGTIANLYKNKGLKFLILAAAGIKEKNTTSSSIPFFIIIGDGPEKENLEKLIKKQNLENRIFLTGFIPDAYKYLKALDLFVLPSIKEGQPWVILEAMAAEVPIVATNIAGIPEMIENEKSGLLAEPADGEALNKAIEKMLTHTSLAKECTRNAAIIVKEKFGLEEMIKKNEELF